MRKQTCHKGAHWDRKHLTLFLPPFLYLKVGEKEEAGLLSSVKHTGYNQFDDRHRNVLVSQSSENTKHWLVLFLQFE